MIEPEAADDPAELAQDLSVAFLLLLERLSPLERAAFLLHDVFEMSFAQVEVLRRDEAACRQLAARARKHIEAGRPRFNATAADQARIAAAFLAAAGSGDARQLAAVLAQDAVLISDGGGKATAALNPIFGRDKVVALIIGLRSKGRLPEDVEYRPSIINGLPGFILVRPDGTIDHTLSFEVQDDVIHRLYVVRNPDKLKGIRP